jgi:hypothetical protein
MPDPDLIQRIEILEQEVAGLELLPACMTAVESQILQLDSDMRAGFSAIRQEMASAISQLKERLGERIRSGDEETRRYMRVLHEDVIERISRIQEGPTSRRRKR